MRQCQCVLPPAISEECVCERWANNQCRVLLWTRAIFERNFGDRTEGGRTLRGEKVPEDEFRG